MAVVPIVQVSFMASCPSFQLVLWPSCPSSKSVVWPSCPFLIQFYGRRAHLSQCLHPSQSYGPRALCLSQFHDRCAHRSSSIMAVVSINPIYLITVFLSVDTFLVLGRRICLSVSFKIVQIIADMWPQIKSNLLRQIIFGHIYRMACRHRFIWRVAIISSMACHHCFMSPQIMFGVPP